MDEEGSSGFDPFFRMLFPVLARSMTLIVGDFHVGQDVAQESLARLYRAWGDMESWDHARNFAYRVATNLAYSHLRRNRFFFLAGLVSPKGHPYESSIQLRTVDERILIEDGLARLSPHQRACIVLVDYAGMAPAEVADLLKMKRGTVYVHLNRGRRRLRALLSRDSVL